MANLSVDGFQWTIQAILISSTNTSNYLIYQTQAKLDNDGYILFNNLGVSFEENNLIIEFSFIKPIEINT